MLTHPPTPYPTTPSLTFPQVPGSLPGNFVPEDVDLSIFPPLAQEYLQNLTTAPLTPDAIWRDFFALTGRLGTFNGSHTIIRAWADVLGTKKLGHWKTEDARRQQPTATSSWIDVAFTFVVEGKGELQRNCFGIVTFVPGIDSEGGEDGGWTIWMVRTMMENFEGCGHPDDPSPIFASPKTDASPNGERNEYEVVVIGAGQCGLSVAGRLGALGIKYVLLEKDNEVGSSWSGKYDSVRQHTVREMNNLPFERTFKKEDPILLPAKTVAEGFQNYVEKYRINIWLGAQTENCDKQTAGGWKMSVRVGTEMKLLRAKNLVLALGAGVSVPNPPDILEREKFTGDVVNMRTYKNCSLWTGKKGIVVGSGTGAHDIAQDMLDAGLSQVTMIQRGKTPVFPIEWIVQGQSMVYNMDIPPTIADRQVSLMPLKVEREMMKLNLGGLVVANSERFDALEKSGFQVDRDAVLTDYLYLRGGGYYIDVGTSKRIADGDIRVKSGVKINKFTRTGLKFEDGEDIDADLVVFATGYQKDIRLQAAGIVGHEIAVSIPEHRVLDSTGEVSGYMLPGAEHLWVIRGAVNEARFYSRFIALQIQADLLGKALPDCQWSNINGTGKSNSRFDVQKRA